MQEQLKKLGKEQAEELKEAANNVATM